MFSSNFIIAQYVPFVLMWRRLLYIGFESNVANHRQPKAA